MNEKDTHDIRVIGERLGQSVPQADGEVEYPESVYEGLAQYDIPRLLGIVERLSTVDDAMVERAARASWAHEHAQAWDELGPVRKEHHMASTRAALEAALKERGASNE